MHNFKKGVLMHYHIIIFGYKWLFDNLNDNDYILICEDDITFCENFIDEFNRVINIASNDKNWDFFI